MSKELEAKNLYLEEQVSRLRHALNRTTEIMKEERAIANAEKNRVVGGFYMMSRKSEKNLRELALNKPTASQMFSVIREHMQIGSNALTISHSAMAKILNVHPRTVMRAAKHLEKHNYLQIIKTGGTNTYIVNERIAFAGSKGQRTAVFSATVIAHESEQSEGWDKVDKLRAVPVIYDGERALIGDEELPPPDQLDIKLT